MPYDEPNMSDNTLLVSVEDLINIALGPEDKNVVNFKVVQTVLHILARQQRMLEQRVEIRITEVKEEGPPPVPQQPKKPKKPKESEGSSRSSSPQKQEDTSKAEKEKAKAEKEAKKREEKEKAMLEKEKLREAKEKEKELKAQEKAEKSARREKEKAEKAEQKELDKAQKEKEKAERASEKEREKAEKLDRKEKERAEKEAAKAKKEKEQSDRSASPGPKGKKKQKVDAKPSISISEVERGKEKVLVVEKGPTTRSEPRSRGASIDVVTQSQFAMLEAAVRGLMEKAAPMGELKMPDNEKLKSALAKGSASLTDTMQAMQVNARVKAAEEAIDRMAGLLTQLAAAGAVPEALADKVQEAKREAERTLTTSDTDESVKIRARPSTARKSVAIDPMVRTSQLARPSTARASSVPTPRASISTVMGRASVMSQPSSTVTTLPVPKVTRDEMEDIVRTMKDDLWKNMNNMTTKATAAAENAVHTAKAVAEKLEVAIKLDNRISNLHSLVADYAEQLSGFDAGLTTQMQSFQEQVMQIRSDLTGGLKLLESVNNNAETAAVMELTERYEDLVAELERTMTAHRTLNDFQGHLGDELRSLIECVEMLREQKADRDEVIDGLRDKADTSRLAGLLTEVEFARARAELARRLQVCHDKFNRQDGVWMGAIKDLLKTTDLKAEIIDLLSVRDSTQWQLRDLHSKLKILAAVLGEPKAALLTRQLARNAVCGACGAIAVMGMMDPSTGVPPMLPALRPLPPDEGPCIKDLKDWMPPEPLDNRHICLRWCGGSHTLLSEHTTREEAPPLQLQEVPTRKYVGCGLDGRLYMMEEQLEPCMECNELLEQEQEGQERPAPVGEEGAGDQGLKKTSIP